MSHGVEEKEGTRSKARLWGAILASGVLVACGEEAQRPAEGGEEELSLCERPGPQGMQFGTALGDEALALGTGPDGALYVAGFENGVMGQSNLGPEGQARGFVLRVGASGQVEWRRSLDTPGVDAVEALVVEPGGARVWAAGRTTGAFEGFSAKGQFDGFLASLTAEGMSRVEFQWGDERPQHPVRLSLEPGGAVVVAGYDDIYVPSNYVEAWEDPFLLRLERGSEGAWGQAWLQSRDSNESDMHTGVSVGQGAESYVSGNILAGASRGAFVQRRDTRGEVVWSRWLSQFQFDTAAAVVALPGGDVVVAGTTFGAVGDQPLRGDQQAYVARLDGATGETRWVTQAGTPGSEFVTALAVDARGHAYVAGDTGGRFEGATGEQGDADPFVLEFGSDGVLLGTWQHGSAGGGDDHVADVAVDACGRVFIAGYTRGAFIAGSAASGDRDAFLAPVTFNPR
ncbi:MAG: SBBP repeat-containing protein [Myxococcaceae bacterium]|nr:SBBP repeat-containing protein [Myxococcaceae bacterium]